MSITISKKNYSDYCQMIFYDRFYTPPQYKDLSFRSKYLLGINNNPRQSHLDKVVNFRHIQSRIQSFIGYEGKTILSGKRIQKYKNRSPSHITGIQQVLKRAKSMRKYLCSHPKEFHLVYEYILKRIFENEKDVMDGKQRSWSNTYLTKDDYENKYSNLNKTYSKKFFNKFLLKKQPPRVPYDGTLFAYTSLIEQRYNFKDFNGAIVPVEQYVAMVRHSRKMNIKNDFNNITEMRDFEAKYVSSFMPLMETLWMNELLEISVKAYSLKKYPSKKLSPIFYRYITKVLYPNEMIKSVKAVLKRIRTVLRNAQQYIWSGSVKYSEFNVSAKWTKLVFVMMFCWYKGGMGSNFEIDIIPTITRTVLTNNGNHYLTKKVIPLLNNWYDTMDVDHRYGKLQTKMMISSPHMFVERIIQMTK